jgi:hypothetical protein
MVIISWFSATNIQLIPKISKKKASKFRKYAENPSLKSENMQERGQIHPFLMNIRNMGMWMLHECFRKCHFRYVKMLTFAGRMLCRVCV